MPAQREEVRQQHLLSSLGISAAAACIAEASTLPLDTVKVRLQLQNKQLSGRSLAPIYTTPMQTLNTIARTEGPTALFKGLEAGLHRQFLFTGLRIGLYAPIQQAIGGDVSPDCMPVHVKVLSALVTSAIGITIANPSDVVKVRTQAAASPAVLAAGSATATPPSSAARPSPSAQPPAGPGRQPGAPQLVCKDGKAPAPPRGARFMAAAPSGALSAEQLILRQPALSTYMRIARTEGLIGGLYAGFVPNLLRNTIISACEIVAYDVAKQRWKGVGLHEGPVLHITSGLTAGFVATVLGSPMDVVSTRIMVNRGRDPGRASMVGTIVGMCRTEGLASFYQGFFPNFLRIGSFNIVLWMSYEQLKLYFDSR